MTEKKIEVPSIVEAAAMASLLDKMGEYKSADLMDQFVKFASENPGNFVKQAGFFSNIMKRLKGRVKSFFFKEYKELFKFAKDAQAKLDERVKTLNEEGKELRTLLKTHELFDWRNKIASLPGLYAKDIMESYDMAYGKIAAYLVKAQEKQQKEEDVGGELEKMKGPGAGMEEGVGESVKPGEPEKKSEKLEPLSVRKYMKEKAARTLKKDDPNWRPFSPGIYKLYRNEALKQYAIDRKYFDDIADDHFSSDDSGQYRQLLRHKKKYPGGFESAFGEDLWRIDSADDDWVILSKVSLEPEKDIPKGEKPKEPGEPELPKPELEGEVKPEEIQIEEDKAVQVISYEELLKQPSDKEIETAMADRMKDRIWVMFKGTEGKVAPITINQFDKTGKMHFNISEHKPELVKQLNQSLFNQYKTIRDIAAKRQEQSKQEQGARDSFIESLLDSIITQGSDNRISKLNKILKV